MNLMKCNKTCILEKIECKAFIIHVQEYTKEYQHKMVYGENCLQLILFVLHYLNYKEIDIHYRGLLQDRYCITRCA